MEKAFIQKLREIIGANVGNPQFGVDELAREMGMGYYSLLRKVRSTTGKSINQVIRETRMHKAYELLQQEELTAAEVSYKLGFSSPAYFNNSFREFFGYPPGEVRKRNDQGEGGEGVLGNVPREVNGIEKKEMNKESKKDKRTGQIVFAAATGFLIILFCLVFFSIISVSDKNDSASMESPGTKIAVMPFDNLSKDTSRLLDCIGFQQILETNLQRINSFTVISGSDKYRNTNKTYRIIGKELGVDLLVTGSIGFEETSHRIIGKLIEAKTGRVLWAMDTVKKTEMEPFAAQSEMARSIASELNITLTPQEVRNINKIPTANPDAWKYYEYARYYSEKVSPVTALTLYQKAIDLDPGFALAYVGVANSLIWQYVFNYDHREKVLLAGKKAAVKALELDPDLHVAKVALGGYYSAIGDRKKSLENYLDLWKNKSKIPNYYNTIALGYRELGMWDEAVKNFRKAADLEPENLTFNLNAGNICNMVRDYPSSIRYLNQVLRLNPRNTMPIGFLSDIALKSEGDVPKARKIMEDAESMIPDMVDFDRMRLIYRHALLDMIEGKYDHALLQLARCKDELEAQDNYTRKPKYLLYATVYGLMKNPGLERAYYDSTRLFCEDSIKYDPANQKDSRLFSTLGVAYAGLGQYGKAVELGKKAVEMAGQYQSAMMKACHTEDLAFIMMKSGKKEEALKLLEEVLSKPAYFNSRLLELDPGWAPLRNLPGFRKLLQTYSGK